MLIFPHFQQPGFLPYHHVSNDLHPSTQSQPYSLSQLPLHPLLAFVPHLEAVIAGYRPGNCHCGPSPRCLNCCRVKVPVACFLIWKWKRLSVACSVGDGRGYGERLFCYCEMIAMGLVWRPCWKLLLLGSMYLSSRGTRILAPQQLKANFFKSINSPIQKG